MNTNLSITQSSYARHLLKFAAFIVVATGAAAQTYTVTNLGTLSGNSNGSYSVAYCINTGGQIGGTSSAPSRKITAPAFIYSNGQLTNIGTLGGATGEARSINTSG